MTAMAWVWPETPDLEKHQGQKVFIQRFDYIFLEGGVVVTVDGGLHCFIDISSNESWCRDCLQLNGIVVFVLDKLSALAFGLN